MSTPRATDEIRPWHRRIRGLVNRSLRVKLALMLLAVTALSVATLGLVITRVTQAALRHDVGERLGGLATLQAQAIGDLLTRQIDALETVGLNDVVQDGVEAAGHAPAAPADHAQRERQWQTADDRDPLIQAYLGSPIALELKEYRDTFIDNRDVLVTDMHGDLVAATTRMVSFSQAQEPWWLAYQRGKGRLMISQPAVDPHDQAVTMVFAIPLYKNNMREVIGASRSTCSLASVAALLGAVRIGKTGTTRLILPDGRMLTSTGRLEPAGLATPTKAHASFAEASEEVRPGDQRRLVAYTHVTSSDADNAPTIAGLDWIVRVDQDAAEAFAPVHAAARAILFGGLAALVGAGVLAILLARAFGARLTRLSQVAEQIAAGDLAIRSRTAIRAPRSRANSRSAFSHSMIACETGWYEIMPSR